MKAQSTEQNLLVASELEFQDEHWKEVEERVRLYQDLNRPEKLPRIRVRMLSHGLNVRGGHLLAIRSKLRGPGLCNADSSFNRPSLRVISSSTCIQPRWEFAKGLTEDVKRPKVRAATQPEKGATNTNLVVEEGAMSLDLRVGDYALMWDPQV